MAGSCSRISRGSRLMRCSFVSSLQALGINFVVRFLGLRFAPTQAIIFRAYSTFEFGLREQFFVTMVQKFDPCASVSVRGQIGFARSAPSRG